MASIRVRTPLTFGSYENLPDVKIMHAIGREMPRVFRGETTILEHLLVDHLLDDYYVHAYGFPQVQKWCAGVVSQITNRYPDMNILELGQSFLCLMVFRS